MFSQKELERIPPDVWDKARSAALAYHRDGRASTDHFAMAIMAERDRCELVVRDEQKLTSGNDRWGEKTIRRILDRIRGVS